MATKKYNGNLEKTQSVLTKAGVKNPDDLAKILASAAQTEEERQTIETLKSMGIVSASDVAKLQDRNAELVKANDDHISTITEKDRVIAELEGRLQVLSETVKADDTKNRKKIKDLQDKVKSLKGQRSYLVKTIGELREEIGQLELALLLRTAENEQLTKKLETSNKKVKKAWVVAAAGFALAVVLGASSVVSSIGWANQNQKVQAMEKDHAAKVEMLEDQIDVLEQDRDQAVSNLTTREKQIYDILDRTITNFVLTESMVFADQNIPEGQAPEKITVFGDEYDINVSELGKAYYLHETDEQITMDYFADLSDGLEFVNGYANEYLPMHIEELETEIDGLEKELEEAKQNMGTGTGNSAEYEATIAALNERIAELEAELDAVKLNSAEIEQTLTKEIETLNNTITGLTEEVEAAETAREEAEAARDALQTEKDNLQVEYEVLEEMYEEAIASGKVNDSTTKALAEKLVKVEEELATTKADLESAQQQLAVKDADYADLVSDYNELQSELITKETKITELETKVAQLESRIADLEAELEDSAVKEESPSNSNTNQGSSNTPVADENNPDSYQPDDNNNEYNKDDQPMNGR